VIAYTQVAGSPKLGTTAKDWVDLLWSLRYCRSMTDPNYSHITILADRTGSMGAVTDPGRTRALDATEGIHAFIKDQASFPGRTTFSLVQFCTSGVERIAWFAQGDDKALTNWKCVPYGGTPLLDALGKVITETGMDLAALPEDQRPGRMFFVVATDGEENSSVEYRLSQIRDMITTQRDAYQWEFVFLGAGIDAFAEGAAIGVARGSTISVNSGSTQSMAASYAGTSSAVKRSRATGQSVSYSDQERKEAGK
jgi:hypothetical protein